MKLPYVPHARVNLQPYVNSCFVCRTLDTHGIIAQNFVLSDYPLLMGIFLLASVSVIAANLIVDLLYGWLDPRVGLR